MKTKNKPYFSTTPQEGYLKKTHVLRWLILLFTFLSSTCLYSCSNDDIIEEPDSGRGDEETVIEIKDLVGVHCIAEYLIDNKTETDQIGNIWEITENEISFDDINFVSFTYQENTLIADGITYSISEDNGQYIFSFTEDEKKIKAYLVEHQREGILDIDEIAGEYVAVDYIVSSEGSPTREINEVTKAWVITSENITIEEDAPIVFTYRNNMLISEGMIYNVEKKDETLIITFRNDGSFTTATLQPQTTEPEIPFESITGKFSVTRYDVTENGSTISDNDLLSSVWEISEEHIKIGENTFDYNYRRNMLVTSEYVYHVQVDEDIIILEVSEADKAIVINLKEYEEPTEPEGPQIGNVELDKMYGYAAYGTTTGGENATAENTHHFDNGDAFRMWLAAREKAKSKVPAKVYLSGKFTKENGRSSSSPWFDIKRTENISIYGTDGFKMENVGLFLAYAKNIIIRNVYIELPKADNGADGISMQSSSSVWVDHCTFKSINQTKDYEDGSCDITHASYNVTLSWNHFIKSQKSILIGHSNSASADVAIRATLHHNFFDQSNSRHPRVRFGEVHVFNNFYNQVETYGVGSAYGAKVLVESNYFDGVRLPTDICTYPAKPSGSSFVSNLNGSEAGFLFARDNEYINKPANASDPYPFTNVEYNKYSGDKLATPYTLDNFLPPYIYVVDNVKDIASIVPSGAGVGKLTQFANAPIPVDNAGIDPGEGGGGEDPDEPEDPIELAGDWKAISVGGDAASGFSASENGISITGRGKYESGAQMFSYVYKEITGNFVITAKIEKYTTDKNSNQSQAGVLFTTDINDTGTNLLHALSGAGQNLAAFFYSHRLETGKNGSRGNLTTTSGSGDIYVKLQRIGNKYSASYSADGGETYSKPREGEFVGGLPTSIYVGLAVNSGDNSKTANAVFSDVRIDSNLQVFFEED